MKLKPSKDFRNFYLPNGLVWGARGRWFESSPPDESPDVNQDFIFCWNCVLSNFEVCGM